MEVKMSRKGFKKVESCKDLASFIRDGHFARLELADDDDSDERMEVCVEEVEQVSRFLEDNSVLTVLSLNGIGLNDAGATHLARAIQKNQRLRELEIQDNEVGGKGGLELGNMLNVNKKLHVLDVGSNCLGAKGCAGLFQGLMENTSLRILLMCNNNAGAGKGGVEQIAECLRQNKTLRTLDLSNNKLGDDGMAILAPALEVNQTLESLSLEFNQVRSSGADVLLKAMQSNHSILFFNFKDNKSMKLFAAITTRNQTRIIKESKVAFAEVLESNETTHWRRGKLMVIGHGKAGKTATVNSLLRRPFTPEWDSTIGVALTQSKTTLGRSWQITNNQSFSVELANRIAVAKLHERRIAASNQQQKSVETGGEEERGKSRPKRAGSAGGQNQVDVGNDRFFQMFNLEDLRNTFLGGNEEGGGATPNNQFHDNYYHDDEYDDEDYDDGEFDDGGFDDGDYDDNFDMEEFLNLLDNLDLEEDEDDYSDYDDYDDEEEEEEEDDHMAQYDQGLFFQTKNERETLSMSIWDCGGQTVFHTLHHLFITRYAVYLLVFDMSHLMANPDEAIPYLEFWLNSVKLHAAEAPVILIGTFRDKLRPGKEAQELQQIQTLLALEERQLGSNLVPNVVQSLSFWPVSNLKHQGIKDIRHIIESTTLKQQYINTEVSIRWMRVLDMRNESSDIHWISFSKLKAETAQLGITSDAEIEQMCRLFHELGVVLYFTSSEVLKGLIILEPQWLIDSFCQVIRDRNIHTFNMAQIKQCGLLKDLKSLFQDGLVSRDMLEFLWNRTQVDYLISLMHTLMLLSPWKFGDLQDEMYLIPSMAVEDIDVEKREQPADAHKIGFAFEFLPTGVYERLVCLCVEHSSSYTNSKEPTISSRFCSVWFADKSHVHLARGEASVDITIIVAEDVTRLLHLFRKMLVKIKDDLMGSAFEWKVLVSGSNEGELIPLETAMKERIEPWCTPPVVKSNSFTELNLDNFLT